MNFSRRNDTAPAPPSPERICTLACSRNFIGSPAALAMAARHALTSGAAESERLPAFLVLRQVYAMKVVSYNIQYGTGLDGRYDIGRIAEAVRDADVIALQEVCRNNPRNGGRDMVAELTAALPDRFFVYGPNFEADIGSQVKNGRAETRMFQFGNMILSRTPIR